MNDILRSMFGALAIALACSPKTCAQIWCPPGAEWRYGFITLDPLYESNGVQQWTYAGDSLFQGEACQHIRSEIYLFDTAGTPQVLGPFDAFTTVTGTAIRVWNASVPGFDTLAWLDATPGAQWTIHDLFQDKVVTVQDTGTRYVDDLPLKYVLITTDPPFFGLSPDTIFERIGARMLNNFLPLSNWFMESPTLNGLGCYKDDELTYVLPSMGQPIITCDFPLEIFDTHVTADSRFVPFPDPGSDRIWFGDDTSTTQLDVRVIDAYGRIVLEDIIDPVEGLDVRALRSGSYFMQLRTGDGPYHRAKWIKE